MTASILGHGPLSAGVCVLGLPGRQAGRPLGPQPPALEIALGDPNSPHPTQLLMPPRLILGFCWGESSSGASCCTVGVGGGGAGPRRGHPGWGGGTDSSPGERQPPARPAAG